MCAFMPRLWRGDRGQAMLTRFPALAVTLMLAGCGAPATVSDQAPAQQALTLINTERAKAGCGPLVEQPQLTAAASAFADSMAQDDFFSHNGPDGSTMVSRIRAQGFRGGMLGENIAAGQTTARQVVSTWMNSPGHRANILNCRFNVTGIAMTRQANDQTIPGNPGPYHTYWVHDFGRQ
jgi:uncharacterized protein YkwD